MMVDLIDETYRIYSLLVNREQFSSCLFATAYDLWVSHHFNLLDFLVALPSLERQKLRARISLGEPNNLKQIYSLLSLLYTKIECLPEELFTLYQNFKNVAVFIGHLTPHQLELVKKWTVEIFSENEYEKYLNNSTFVFFDPEPPAPVKPVVKQSAPPPPPPKPAPPQNSNEIVVRRGLPHRWINGRLVQISKNPVSTAPIKNSPALQMKNSGFEKNSYQPNPSRSFRSLAELKKNFG